MSELDLGLKVGSRRLFWNMGYSTRLDVALRGDKPPPSNSNSRRRPQGPESFTDLDVLGVAIAPGFRVTSAIADCKTSPRESTSRMFWIRGLAEFFGAEQRYLVREHDVADAARQLATRLNITVLTSSDLQQMQALHPDGFDVQGPLAVLFDREPVARHLHAFTGLDRRLRKLLDYREFDYWVIDERRNLQRLVTQVSSVRDLLHADNPVHVALFLDLAWLYLLTLVHAVVHIRAAYLNDIDRGAREYLFGGAAGLEQKKRLAAQLRTLAPDTIPAGELDHLPVYYTRLRELLVRLLRRPGSIQASLRHLEVGTAFAVARTPMSTVAALHSDPGDGAIAAKLAADVCGFLVSACELAPRFRQRARELLLGEQSDENPIASAPPPPHVGQQPLPESP